MKRIVVISSILYVCCLIFGLTNSKSADSLDLEEGQYEITYRSEMPGMPTPMPPMTFTQCITKQDPVPNQSQGNQQCTVKDMRTIGNTVSWTMECDQHGSTMQATGKMTFHGDSFEGETHMQMGPDAGNREIVTKMKGKRIGPCS